MEERRRLAEEQSQHQAATELDRQRGEEVQAESDQLAKDAKESPRMGPRGLLGGQAAPGGGRGL